MRDAKISRVRRRDLTRLGRSRTEQRPEAGRRPARELRDAESSPMLISIGNALSSRPERPARVPNLRSRGIAHLEDPSSERASGQLDRQLRGRVLVVEDRVDLDELERAQLTALGHQFHHQMRLPV
jgi:hypothetical protein